MGVRPIIRGKVAGESDQVSDLVWSPSGALIAFVSTALAWIAWAQ